MCVCRGRGLSPAWGPAPASPFHLPPLAAPPPVSAPRRDPPPQEERRAAAVGKREVCAAQNDAKILEELFGGGYLEIRPCEGPGVQIPPPARSSGTGSGRPQCLEGARVAPRPPALAAASPRTPAGGSAFLLASNPHFFPELRPSRAPGTGAGGCAPERWAPGSAAPSREARAWTRARPEGEVTVEWTSGLWRFPLPVAPTGFVVPWAAKEDPVKMVLSKALGEKLLWFHLIACA